ncbi:MAG: ABC transporter permease [Holophaga sp.]|jgi:simple sugar transport system permease protein
MPEATRLRSLRATPAWRTGTRGAAVCALALAVFAAILLVAGKDPVRACADTFKATLASGYGLSELLVRMTPLLLTAVAVALPSRLGLINVGGEGQLYLGAWLASAGALAFPSWPAWALLPLVLVLGFLGGALWAAIPGLLRAARLVNETIATLLLNYVAPLIVSYYVFGPWRSTESSAYPQSAAFADAALLPPLFDTRVHAGLFIALAALGCYWLLMEKTRWGVDMRAIGGNPEAARRLGLPVRTWIVAALALGGGLAGLAGMGEAMGIHGRLREGLSPGYGFTGFLISWLAGGRPLGILFMAFLFAILTAAGDTLQITQGLPYSAINILLALILFIVLARRPARGGGR